MGHLQRRAAGAELRSSKVRPRGNSSRKTTRSEKPGARRKPMRRDSCLEQQADVALVARLQAGEAVAHDDPVDRAAIGQARRFAAPRPSRHRALGPMISLPSRSIRASRSRSRKLSLSGVISVSACAWPRREQAGVAARRIDDDEVALGELASVADEPRASSSRAALAAESSGWPRAGDAGQRQRQPLRRRRPGGSRNSATSVPWRASRSMLPTLMAVAQQRDDHMHRGGRLARAALLVAEHDDVRLAPRP